VLRFPEKPLEGDALALFPGFLCRQQRKTRPMTMGRVKARPEDGKRHALITSALQRL
jgi:hypothetical protein